MTSRGGDSRTPRKNTDTYKRRRGGKGGVGYRSQKGVRNVI